MSLNDHGKQILTSGDFLTWMEDRGGQLRSPHWVPTKRMPGIRVPYAVAM